MQEHRDMKAIENGGTAGIRASAAGWMRRAALACAVTLLLAKLRAADNP